MYPLLIGAGKTLTYLVCGETESGWGGGGRSVGVDD
jgi:hypothetical protein